MWKILAIIGAVALVGAGVFGYQNKLAYENEIDLRKAAEKQRDDTTAQLATTKGDLKKTEDELAVVQQAVVKLKAELSTTDLAVSEQEKKETELSAELDGLVDKIAAGKTVLEEVGGIDQLNKEMESLTTELAEADQMILSAQNAVAIADQRRANLQTRIDSYLELEREQRTGTMRKWPSMSVETAYNQWGFVVINAGDRQGVVPKAELAVARQGMQVCRLLVTNVEPDSSVATIVPGTLAPGQAVQPGDVVVILPKAAPQPATAGS